MKGFEFVKGGSVGIFGNKLLHVRVWFELEQEEYFIQAYSLNHNSRLTAKHSCQMY